MEALSTCSNRPGSSLDNGCKLVEESTISRPVVVLNSNSPLLEVSLCISDIITLSDIASPHIPPVPPPKLGPRPGSIRLDILRNYQGYRINNVRHYMEERMVRWRPSSSSHGNDNAIAGIHPFQLQQDPSSNLPSGENVSWLQQLSIWWTSWTSPKIATERSLGLSYITSGRVNDTIGPDGIDPGQCPVSVAPAPLGIPLFDLTFTKEPTQTQNSPQHDDDVDVWSLEGGNFLTCCFYGQCSGW